MPQVSTGQQYALESRSQRMLLGSSRLVVLLAADIERDDGGVDSMVTGTAAWWRASRPRATCAASPA